MLKRASSSSVGETPDIVETRALIEETHNTSTVLLAKADMVLSTLTKEALAEVVVTCYRCDHKRGQGKPKCPSCFNGEAASSSASSSASPAVGPVSFLGAGSVCVAHSPMGDRQGLYHESAIVLMTWLHIIRARRVPSFFHECSDRFDKSIISSILKDWKLSSAKVCPSMAGQPIFRKRSLTIGYLPEVLVHTSDADKFLELYTRDRVGTCDMYFAAPDEIVQKDWRGRARAQRLPELSMGEAVHI
mmetsp:Transcript_79823/g.258651  ORF Transcript_79823/g.258651 Transcript_79823/m.258651 type:complete len:246 (+) Transcript_79823:882-1619(+)